MRYIKPFIENLENSFLDKIKSDSSIKKIIDESCDRLGISLPLKKNEPKYLSLLKEVGDLNVIEKSFFEEYCTGKVRFNTKVNCTIGFKLVNISGPIYKYLILIEEGKPELLKHYRGNDFNEINHKMYIYVNIEDFNRIENNTIYDSLRDIGFDYCVYKCFINKKGYASFGSSLATKDERNVWKDLCETDGFKYMVVKYNHLNVGNVLIVSDKYLNIKDISRKYYETVRNGHPNEIFGKKNNSKVVDIVGNF